MIELKSNESMLIILFFVGLLLCMWFLVIGKIYAKKEEKSKFDRIALSASITAMFLAQITSAFGNYNVVEIIKHKSIEAINALEGDFVYDSEIKAANNLDETPANTEDTNDLTSEALKKIVDNNTSIIFKESTGINIGSYYTNADAYVRFRFL